MGVLATLPVLTKAISSENMTNMSITTEI